MLILVLGSMSWSQVVRRGPRGKVKVLISVDPAHLDPRVVRVEIASIQGDSRQTTVLKGERSCLFENVSRGEYLLLVDSEGFDPVEQPFSVNPFNRNDEILVTATLRVSEGEALPGRDSSTVSVEQLSVPKEAREKMQQAEKASRRNRPADAIKHLNKALELHPSLYQAYNNLAVEYLRLGQVENAETALVKSIEIESGDATTHRNLSEIYISQARYREALRTLDTAFGLQPKNARNFMLLGELFRAAGRCDIAVPYFQTASNIDGDSHSHLGLADCFMQSGEVQKARDELRAFLTRYPHDVRSSAVRSTLAGLDSREPSSP